jgi:hypothetical protein
MKPHHTKPYICNAMQFTGNLDDLVAAGIAYRHNQPQGFSKMSEEPDPLPVQYWDQDNQIWVDLPEGLYLVKEPNKPLYTQTQEHFLARWVEDGPTMRDTRPIRNLDQA